MAAPMWRQIADDLRTKIEAGELGADGQPLPTELELQDIYSASRNTVRDAIRLLVTRGLVFTRSGQGTFVARKPDPFVTKLGVEREAGMEESRAFEVAVRDERRDPEVTVPRVEILRADELVRRALDLPEDASVISRHQRRFIDGDPYSLQTTFYAKSLLEAGAHRLIEADNIAEGAVNYLESTLGLSEIGLVDQIASRLPDQNEVEFFGLPDDGRVQVFQLIRTGFDQAGHPLRVTVTTLPADRNQFVLVSGHIPK
jgi:GntR family transcriptional regulator